MDGHSTTFGKQHGITITRRNASIILGIFAALLVGTGLLVYNLSPTCPQHPLLPSPISPEPLNCTQVTSESSSTEQHISTVETTTSIEENTTHPIVQKLDVRLPRNIVPDRYDIRIIPFIFEDNFTFHGVVNIVINITEETLNISLHFDDMKIDTTSLTVHELELNSSTINRQIDVKEITYDTDRQFLIIHLNEILESEMQYDIHIQYKGVLNDILQGFYRSSYTVKNQTRWIATTQFQPTDARRAFPCFDEPAMKAKFKISLARPRNMSSISNMPQTHLHESVDNIPDYVWDHYEESLPMSTYLVAFAVTDFGNLTDGNFSVWARKEALPQANYSLIIGPRILRHYEDFFQIPFPLPKVDMIALPDFSAGAMENWGLITYRETAMLYQEGVSTSLNLQRVATVIAHELAHQWFGNLVTPSWWTDLWLNEGFATYVEYIGTNAVEPEWKILDQFVIQQHYAFALDALATSHQISIKVGHPDEINEIFDRISYAKGAAVIRMMNYFLTEQVFKEGLTYYLNNRKYSNAEQDDLWEALTLRAHKYKILNENTTVKQIMDTWTLQTGLPVVTVTRSYPERSASLTQERFLLLSDDNKTMEQYWWIPITYTTQNELNFKNTSTKLWMQQTPEDVLENINATENQWILLNIQQTGYYRVNYDNQNWRLLTEHLLDKQKFSQIGSTNRAQLINDAMNLAQAGRLDYNIALNVTRYLVHERDYVPLQAAISAFSYIDVMFVRTGHYDKLKDYMLSLIKGLYDDIRFHEKANDSQLTIYKRIDLLPLACNLGHQDCIRNSVREFQNWRSLPNPDKNNPISPNLKSIVYCTALKVGGQDEWEFAWQRYINSNVGSEKEILLSAMGCSKETWILSRYLDRAITENAGIRKQDAPRVFATVAISNPIGQDLAFNFLRSNWLKIKEYMGSSLSVINNIARVCTKNRNTIFDVKNLKEFKEENEHDLGTAMRTMNQAIEDAEANLKWMDTNYQTIVQWLETWKVSV